MLFKDEKFNVSQIRFVTNYNPQYNKIHKFKGCLPTHELMYFYKGDLRLEFADKSFYVKTGDMVYLPKGINNQKYHIVSNKEFGVYNVYFETNDPLPKEAVHIPLQNKNLKTEFETIYRVWTVKRKGYYLKAMGLFYEILRCVLKQQSSYTKHKNNDFFLKIEEYMSEHFCDKDFSFDELAKCTGFSYSYFKKVFISRYGVPPIKYLTELKINYACELFSIEKYNVSEVAELCGYENVYYFSTVFKKYKGLSPKNYITAAKENSKIKPVL